MTASLQKIRGVLRRALTACALCLPLASCASWPQTYDAKGAGGVAVPWVPRLAATTQRYMVLERMNAPVLQATRVSTGERYLLRRLGASTDGVEVWLSPGGSGYSFRGGLLVELRGPEGNLMSSDVTELAQLIASGAGGQAKRFQSSLAGNNQIVTNSYVCDVTWGKSGGASLVREDCAGLEDDMVNTFQIGQNGAVVRSNQLGFIFEGVSS